MFGLRIGGCAEATADAGWRRRSTGTAKLSLGASRDITAAATERSVLVAAGVACFAEDIGAGEAKAHATERGAFVVGVADLAVFDAIAVMFAIGGASREALVMLEARFAADAGGIATRLALGEAT